jgi:hypothetical protein
VVVRLATLLLLVACSGSKTKVEDARKHPSDTALLRDAGSVGVPGMGDVQLRVEWKDVPIEARASAGRTSCGTPRASSVSPTTTWGVPDVFVMIEGAQAKPSPARDARIVLDRCALVPRVALASDKLVLASAAEAPAKLSFHKLEQLPFGGAALGGSPRTVFLPIAGHSVDVALDARGIYHAQIENADGKTFDPESAWIVAADTPHFAITEANGQVLLRDLPVGNYTATAWLPPRGGQPAKIARTPVTITPDGVADVTLDISK